MSIGADYKEVIAVIVNKKHVSLAEKNGICIHAYISTCLYTHTQLLNLTCKDFFKIFLKRMKNSLYRYVT